MNVRELPGLRSIMGFEGEYAIFKAKDEDGNFQGVINRKGEIVWDAKLCPPTLLMHGTTVFMSCIRGKSGFFYYDVVQQQYIEKPEVEPRQNQSQSFLKTILIGLYIPMRMGKRLMNAPCTYLQTTCFHMQKVQRNGVLRI